MKKLLSVFLCVVLLCASVPAVAAADTENILAQIYAANTGYALRENHTSRKITSGNVTVYMDMLHEVTDDPDYYPGIRVRSGEYDYVALTDGGFQRFISLDPEYDTWQFFNEDLFQSRLISVEEQEDTITVTVENWDETQTIIVDADTLELLEYSSGEYTAKVEYDVDMICPDVVEAIEDHLYAEEDVPVRTTTMIFDDGTPYNRTFIFETPVGDGCLLAGLVESNIPYEFDMERSTPTNEARDNNAVYYFVRVTE